MSIITGKKMNLYWIIGLLVLWTGVITADNFAAASEVSTTKSTEISAFIISIKITNRVYNDSLGDHRSQNYKLLRQDVENMFLEVYSSAPSVYYQDIAEMTFSNGSVIANSTVIFGSKQRSGQIVKDIFVTKYKQQSSHTLDLNINYTEDQELILVPNFLLPNILLQHYSTSSSTAGSHILTTSELSEHNQVENNSFVITPTPASMDHDSSASTMSAPRLLSMTTFSSKTIFTAGSISGTHSSKLTSKASGSSTVHTTAHSSNINLNVSGSSTVHTATNLSNMTSNVSGSGTLHTTTHSSNITPNISGSSTVNMTTNPSIKTSTMPSSNPGKNITQRPTGSEAPVPVVADQGVPSWGIAILVLAAVILFLMLVLLIMLLLFWCCWWKQRGFMNVSDPDPTGYYNPDIPMYSTHSTYVSHNGKSLVADSERSSKKQIGVYKVNK